MNAPIRKLSVVRAQAELMRRKIGNKNHHNAGTPEEIKLGILRMVARAIDAKLAHLQEGQSLGIVFNLTIFDKDMRTQEELGYRNDPQSSVWRDAVFQRDNYTCQECGARGYLHAHHISSWATYPDLRFDVSNGTTLCRDCHAAKHPGRENLIKAAKYLKRSKPDG